MKTFIVPTDFSISAKSATSYAAGLVKDLGQTRILLYTVYDNIETGIDSSVVYNDHSARKTIMDLALENTRKEMLEIAPGADIECRSEEAASFLESLERLVNREGASLIIMGITGTSAVQQVVIGSNTLKIAARNVCPVLIVPPDATFQPVHNVAYTTDFVDIDTTTPTAPLREMLGLFKPFIHVVHVDKDPVKISTAYKTEQEKLDKLLEGFDTEYYSIQQDDYVDAINQFVGDYAIDMIFTVPKNHSFPGNLFSASHTRKLAYHSRVPIMAIHE